MRKLELDFQRINRRAQLPGWLLLFIALTATGWEVNQYRTLTERTDALDDRVHRLQRLLARAEQAGQEPATDKNAAIQRNLAAYGADAWDIRFAVFEKAAGEGVTLLSLTPGKEAVVLAGEAKELGAALNYVRRLQDSPVLTDVYVTDTEIAKDKPMQPLRFVVAASWREVAR